LTNISIEIIALIIVSFISGVALDGKLIVYVQDFPKSPQQLQQFLLISICPTFIPLGDLILKVREFKQSVGQ
jgi:hypothetical protein